MYRICFWNKRNAVKIFLAFKFFFVLLNVMFYTSQRWTLYGSWPGRVTVNDSQTWFLGNYTEHCQTFMLPKTANVEVVNVTERYRYRVKQLCPCVPETLSKPLLHYSCILCMWILYCIVLYIYVLIDLWSNFEFPYKCSVHQTVQVCCKAKCRLLESIHTFSWHMQLESVCTFWRYMQFEGVCSLKSYVVWKCAQFESVYSVKVYTVWKCIHCLKM